MASKAKKYKPTDDKRTKGKVFKSEMLPFAELEEGDTIVGVFQNRRQITIRDQRTHEPKEIWIYAFRDVSNGNKFALSGRTMLDQTFEDLIEAEGGIEKVIGETIRINRGDSIKTAGGQLGTYEILLLD